MTMNRNETRMARRWGRSPGVPQLPTAQPLFFSFLFLLSFATVFIEALKAETFPEEEEEEEEEE